MSLYELNGIRPELADPQTVYLAPGSMVIGKVTLGKDVNFWPHAVARGDNELIIIGDGTNIQEHSMLHTDPGFPLTVGKDCTVGHRAILHGPTDMDYRKLPICSRKERLTHRKPRSKAE